MRKEGQELSPINQPEAGTVIRVIEDTLSSHRVTMQNLEAHKTGNLENLNTKGIGFILYYTLVGNRYTEGMLPTKLQKDGKKIKTAWNNIHNRYLNETASRHPDLCNKKPTPLKYMWQQYRSDNSILQTVEEVLNKANELTLHDSSIVPILEKQSGFEEKVLDFIAPKWRHVTESEFKDEHIHLDREPENIEEAMDIVQECHKGTKNTLLRHSTNGEHMLSGGFGTTYTLQAQDGYFASLLTPQQLLDSRRLMIELNNMRKNSARKIIGEYVQDIESYENPYDALESFNERKQDEICGKIERMKLLDEHYVAYFMVQALNEQDLLKHLESVRQGKSLPESKNLEEARDLVFITNEWTKINLETFKNHDWYGWRGGYNRFYQLLGKENALTSNLPEDLVAEGKVIRQKLPDLKKSFLKEAIENTWGIDLDGRDSEEFMQRVEGCTIPLTSTEHYEVRKRALGYFLHSPIAMDYLSEQAKYEEKVLEHLK